jgi:hypothetical protein
MNLQASYKTKLIYCWSQYPIKLILLLTVKYCIYGFLVTKILNFSFVICTDCKIPENDTWKNWHHETLLSFTIIKSDIFMKLSQVFRAVEYWVFPRLATPTISILVEMGWNLFLGIYVHTSIRSQPPPWRVAHWNQQQTDRINSKV